MIVRTLLYMSDGTSVSYVWSPIKQLKEPDDQSNVNHVSSTRNA